MATDHKQSSLVTPVLYQGVIQRPGAPIGSNWSVADAATHLGLPPVLARHGKWAISSEGIHSLEINYTITKDQFDKNDWVNHIERKSWVTSADLGDFIRILAQAKAMVAAGNI